MNTPSLGEARRGAGRPAPLISPAARLVTMFRADQLEPILRNILHCLDGARTLAGYSPDDAERLNQAARVQLHDLLCEVVS